MEQDVFDIDTLTKTLLEMSADELNRVSHAELYTARSRAPKEQQDKLAGPEHRAFTREATTENPLMAIPLLLATIGYQPYKMVKGQSRSGASLDQMKQGLIGVGEGLGNFGDSAMQDVLKALKL
jgi:hypothetical protein